MLLVEVELAGETGSLFRGRGVGVGLKKAERCEALIGLSERERLSLMMWDQIVCLISFTKCVFKNEKL